MYIEDTFVLYLCRICVSDTVFLIFILTHADRHPSNDTMHKLHIYYKVIIYTYIYFKFDQLYVCSWIWSHQVQTTHFGYAGRVMRFQTCS